MAIQLLFIVNKFYRFINWNMSYYCNSYHTCENFHDL